MFNKKQLDQLIEQYAQDSPNYDPMHPPYVVFDCDNTTIFLDIQEAVLSDQLNNFEVAVTPAQLNQTIRMNISNQNFDVGHHNLAGQPVNIDIIASYTWLYHNHEGLKGKKSLAEVQKNPHYMAFVSKMRYLYEAIGDTFDHATSYPWVTYMFTAMDEKRVRDFTAKTIRWQKTQAIEDVTWTTPTS